MSSIQSAFEAPEDREDEGGDPWPPGIPVLAVVGVAMLLLVHPTFVALELVWRGTLQQVEWIHHATWMMGLAVMALGLRHHRLAALGLLVSPVASLAFYSGLRLPEAVWLFLLLSYPASIGWMARSVWRDFPILRGIGTWLVIASGLTAFFLFLPEVVLGSRSIREDSRAFVFAAASLGSLFLGVFPGFYIVLGGLFWSSVRGRLFGGPQRSSSSSG